MSNQTRGQETSVVTRTKLATLTGASVKKGLTEYFNKNK